MSARNPIEAGSASPAAAWHSRTVAEVAGVLDTHLEMGLPAGALPSRTGAAPSDEATSRSAGRILWNQSKSGVILVLLAATAGSFALGHAGDALAIAGVIGLRGFVVAAVVLWTFTSGGGRQEGTGAQTLAMATLALTLLGQSFAMLSEHRPFWRVTGSMTAPFWFALAGGVAIQVLAVAWPPLASVLPAAPLSAADWLRALGMSALALGIVEGGKTFLPVRA